MAKCKRNVISSRTVRQLSILFWVWVLSLCASAAPADARGKETPRSCLLSALAGSSPALLQELQKQLVATPVEAIATADLGESCVVAVARRFPEQVDVRFRQELLQQRVVSELFKWRALKSAPVEASLSTFRFPQLLGDFARRRLVETVKGRLAAEAPAPGFLDYGECMAVVLKVPRKAVQLEFVQLAADGETQAAYVSALLRAVRARLQADDFKLAGQYLAEVGRLGYRAREFFVSLYHCQTLEGNRTEAEKTAKFLFEQHAGGLSFDDCLALAQFATRAGFVAQAQSWNHLADERVKQTLSGRTDLPQPPSP